MPSIDESRHLNDNVYCNVFIIIKNSKKNKCMNFFFLIAVPKHI